ncbi:PPC domain-containing protein [Leptolyngbya sp. PCC 6406]|uniref:PPC domain-containing protein n=1 Tax=Leptolyngbya sp. PCC 6406 TaxID=1173264 RepID=UPI0002AC16F6|nr:PPC domain-containing protein [Leptolyngbya sp. PCC 6406]
MKRLHSVRTALLMPLALAGTVALSPMRVAAQDLYTPIPLPLNGEITDRLSPEDIPTGLGGHARDYRVYLEAGDQVAIDVISDEFDTIVSLIDEEGNTIGENDDGPDGTTNSLLFARITETGNYIVRVRAFGGRGSGQFFLKVARLRPVN